jgi:hypothetical protein
MTKYFLQGFWAALRHPAMIFGYGLLVGMVTYGAMKECL